jgi:phosphoglycolate phosphatase
MAWLNREIDHVIFDWNGTLLDDVDLAVAAVSACCRQYGVRAIDKSTYRRKFRFPIQSFYADLGFDFEHAPFPELVRSYLSLFDSRVAQCRLHYSARTVLNALSAAGVPVSILSASQQGTLERTLRHKGISHHFAHVVGLDDENAASKLKRAVELAEKLRCDPERVLFVGDTDHDAQVAHANGWRWQLVACGHQDEAALQTHTADVFPNLHSLLRVWFSPASSDAA